ncbi:hypothetical protein E2P81_ATG00884 [Venturia nashicola]|uniref:Uncharacterized protein n=1 Tax=Venturia nashicola TaxID=86259 RepID=A0A4Z1PAK3_9PEZI|nr:hypothetical protein E6O75_ATG00901 [Venturia nashicola]TLD38341.1 hypothetical protein E2P81_ATG00884 [Venturia nashicola]
MTMEQGMGHLPLGVGVEDVFISSESGVSMIAQLMRIKLREQEYTFAVKMRDVVLFAALLAFPVSFIIILTKRRDIIGYGHVGRHSPSVPPKTKSFKHQSKFWSFEDGDFANVSVAEWRRTISEWKRIRPYGGGFLQVEMSEQNILPRPIRLDVTKQVPMYSLSIFHQLHCLTAIFSDYVTIGEGEVPKIPPSHTLHCFDYLRQAIMCYGDSTLEHVVSGKGRETLEYGYESPRMCKDFNAVLGYAWDHNVVEIGDLPHKSDKHGGHR